MSSDVRTVNMTIALPLRELGQERKAIEQRINGFISQYVPEVDGILTKWGDLNVLNEKGIIMDDQPYVFWKVSFTAHVFKAMEGKLVKAKVHRLLKSYFLANAMNSFTVTVTIPDSLQENDAIKNLMMDQDVYVKIIGTSEGVYRGELDEECLELMEGLKKQELENDLERGAYDYAKEFEY